MKGLAVTTVAEQAADALRRKILSGELAEGVSLRQDALAAEFGISRIPVREALVQLEGEGLVKIVPHKGAVVSGLSIEEINELFMLRSLLEPVLLKKSAPGLTAADYAELDAILAEYKVELHAQHTTRWGELNTRLHEVLLSRRAAAHRRHRRHPAAANRPLHAHATILKRRQHPPGAARA